MTDMVAYKHPESFQISGIHIPHPTSTLSLHVFSTGTTYTCVTTYLIIIAVFTFTGASVRIA